MKVIFVVIAVIVISLISSFFIPIEQSHEINIEANFFNVLEQLNYPANWKKWQLSLKQDCDKDSTACLVKNDSSKNTFSIETPVHRFYIKNTTPVTFEVEEKTKDNTLFYRINVLSTVLPNKTNIVTIKRVSLFNYIFGNNNKSAGSITAYDLKSFIENPTAYYGYRLTTERTIDTNVVVTKKIVATKNWRPELTSIYNSLSSFIHSNNLRVMQPRIVSLKGISNDSTEISAGIPVDRTVPAKGNINCVKMPKGKVLVGEYKGVYNKRSSLSGAMEKYIRNHFLNQIAVPYEKYLNDSIPETDTSIVRIKIYYPVF